MAELTPEQRTEFEAAAFRALLGHLRARAEVQNIDLMNLAGFCRNCLANWYLDAAREAGAELTRDESREIVYGMTYETWKTLHQGEASDAQKALFEINRPEQGRQRPESA